jgi:hypothetical protein
MFRASSRPSSRAYKPQQQPVFYRWNVVIAVLLALVSPRSYGKTEADAAVDRLLMMGKKMPETCSAVFKRQAINL